MLRKPRHTKVNALAKGGVVPLPPEEVPSFNEENIELSHRSAEMKDTALVPPRKEGKKENAAPLLPQVLKASLRAASTTEASASAPVSPACPAADAPAIASNEPRAPIPVPACIIEVECPGDTPLESEAESEAPASSMGRKRAPNRNKVRRDIWRDPGAKDRPWVEQAQKMNRTVAELKTWYDTMRTRLGRLKQWSQKSGSGPHISKARTAKSFKSKIAASAPKPDKTNIPPLVTANQETAEDASLPASQEPQESVTPVTTLVTTMLSPATFTRSSSTRSPRRQEQDVQLVEALVSASHRQVQLMTLSEQLLSHLRPQGTLEEQQSQLFVDHVGTVLKSLSRDLYRQAQQQIWTFI